MKNGMKNRFFSGATGHGTLTVLLSLLLLVVLVLVNVGVSLLPSEYTVLDSTYNKLYTVSETTEKTVKAIDTDVTLYFLCDNGTEDATVRAFLDRYAGLSSHVTVKTVDPVANPTFAGNYTDATLSNYSVIIESGKRSLAIDYYDLYLWENEALGILTAEEYVACMSDATGSYLLSTYETVQHFNGEAKITNGISYVAADRVPKVYAVSSHGETALGSDLLSTLKANAYDVVTGFSLLAYGGVPADCDLLLLNAPQSDLSADEAEWIRVYLENGGKLFLTTAASKQYVDSEKVTEGDDGSETVETVPSDYPNLVSLLASYGLRATNGVVVETDANLSYSEYPVILLPESLEGHAVTDGVSGATAIFYVAHGIKVDKGAQNVTTLFTTSEKAYTSLTQSTDSYEKDENSENGPFALGVAAEVGDGKLVWLSSGYALDDSVDALVSGGNHTYAVSAFDWLTDKGDGLALPSVSLEEPKLIITGNTVIVFAAFFCGVIPLSILLGGLFYWLKRRKA